MLASELAPSVLKRAGVSRRRASSRVARAPRSRASRCATRSTTASVPSILGEHVTLDSGTGAVHTAPGPRPGGLRRRPAVRPAGRQPGRRRRPLPARRRRSSPARRSSTRTSTWSRCWRSSGALLHHEPFRHSYPHCWRHKTPVIFRATPQWFISMEQAGLRRTALEEIGKVEWTPDWGEQRIYSMIEGRPDWCISRQRTLGRAARAVHAQARRANCTRDTPDLVERVAALVEQGGIDAWFDLDAATSCSAPTRSNYEKVTDIMDVWVDSGVSHHCVSQMRPEIRTPADLYLEGSDQHRGWFHSSLLTSVAQKGHAPYKGVLTHGFTVDEKGRKMSKSLGNVDAAAEGGEHARRRRAAALGRFDRLRERDQRLGRDPEADVGFLPAHPQHRALPARQPGWLRPGARRGARRADGRPRPLGARAHARAAGGSAGRLPQLRLPPDLPEDPQLLRRGPRRLLPRRRSRTASTRRPRRACRAAPRRRPCTGSPRRWCAGWRRSCRSPPRRSGDSCPGERAESVFLSTWAALPPSRPDRRPIDWTRVLEVRSAVLRELERLRVAGEIGAPLDAIVEIYAGPEIVAALEPLGDELRFALITSEAHVHPVAAKPDDRGGGRPGGEVRPVAARARVALRPSACAAGTSGRTSARWRPTRNSARAARRISTAPARPGGSHR